MRSILPFALLVLSAPVAAQACDVTLNSGGNIPAATIAYAGKTICLNAGVYDLGSANLTLAPGTKIQGTAATRDSVVVNSSAVRAFIAGDGTVLQGFWLKGAGGHANEYGIISYSSADVLIWGMRIQGFKINIAALLSTNVDIWDTFLSENGNIADGLANPNIWISESDDVLIYYGAVYGRANGPGGDGEIAAYASTRVKIEGTYVVDSGTSAIYFVDCDSCEIRSATVERANDWGLDIVGGSDNFIATGNVVSLSRLGGSVFVENNSVGGAYTNNEFYNNNQSGSGAYCNGINVVGSVAGVSLSGNIAAPQPVACAVVP